MIFAYTVPTEGAPSLRSLQGWAAMLRMLFDFDVDTRSNPVGDIVERPDRNSTNRPRNFSSFRSYYPLGPP